MSEDAVITVDVLNSSVMSHTLSSLNEDSNYSITVTAFNIAGSTMAMTSADTLTSGDAD